MNIYQIFFATIALGFIYLMFVPALRMRRESKKFRVMHKYVVDGKVIYREAV